MCGSNGSSSVDDFSRIRGLLDKDGPSRLEIVCLLKASQAQETRKTRKDSCLRTPLYWKRTK